MVANLPLRDRPEARGFPLAWDNVLYDSPSLGYVVATHQSGRDTGPTVLTYYLPAPRRRPAAGRRRLLATTWEAWVDAILADLGPRPSRPARPRRERRRLPLGARDGAPAARVPVERSAGRRPRGPLGRLRFAHTDLSGMALFEEAQYWGVRAAAEILSEEGRRLPAGAGVSAAARPRGRPSRHRPEHAMARVARAGTSPSSAAPPSSPSRCSPGARPPASWPA